MNELKSRGHDHDADRVDLNPLNDVERDYIFQVLGHTRWKLSGKKGTAEILGLDHSTVPARMGKRQVTKP